MQERGKPTCAPYICCCDTKVRNHECGFKRTEACLPPTCQEPGWPTNPRKGLVPWVSLAASAHFQVPVAGAAGAAASRATSQAQPALLPLVHEHAAPTPRHLMGCRAGSRGRAATRLPVGRHRRRHAQVPGCHVLSDRPSALLTPQANRNGATSQHAWRAANTPPARSDLVLRKGGSAAGMASPHTIAGMVSSRHGLTANTLPMKPPRALAAATVLRTCSAPRCGLAARVAGVSWPESCNPSNIQGILFLCNNNQGKYYGSGGLAGARSEGQSLPLLPRMGRGCGPAACTALRRREGEHQRSRACKPPQVKTGRRPAQGLNCSLAAGLAGQRSGKLLKLLNAAPPAPPGQARDP